MRSARAATVVVLPTLLVAMACGMSGSRNRADRIALRAPLDAAFGARLSWTFAVKHSGSHAIGLEFTWPIEDQAVADVVNRAIANVGKPAPAEFDFSWHVLEGSQEVAQGSGREGVKTVIDAPATNQTSQTGTPTESRVLVFGTFPAKAGATYRLRLTGQPGFLPLLTVRPVLLVELEPTS